MYMQVALSVSTNDSSSNDVVIVGQTKQASYSFFTQDVKFIIFTHRVITLLLKVF